jgi:hypothetical protein
MGSHGNNWHSTVGTVVVGAGTVVVGAGSVVVGAGTVVVGAGSVVVGAGTVVVERGTVVVERGTVVVGAGSVVDVVAGDVGSVGDVVVVGLVGDVGAGAGRVDVGTADGGTGGKAATTVVVGVTPEVSGLGLSSAPLGIVVDAVDGDVEAFAVDVGESAFSADVSEVDVDGASAISGSVTVGTEVDDAPDPSISNRASVSLPSPDDDRTIGSARAARQPKATSNPLYLSTACATRLSRNPSTAHNHYSDEPR